METTTAVKTITYNDRVFSWAFDYRGVGIYTRAAPMTWLAVVGGETIVANEAWYLYDRIDSLPREPRFYVDAMHKPSNGFDGPAQVDYWRVMDRETGMRANGTAKYETVEQAQRWCDSLNS